MPIYSDITIHWQNNILQLVDWAGRPMREVMRGYIPHDTPLILHRIGLEPTHYLNQISTHRKKLSKSLVSGCQSRIKAYALKLGKKYVRGQPLDIKLVFNCC